MCSIYWEKGEVSWRHLVYKERQCTYNVTFRRVRVTFVAAETCSEFVCSFNYPACKAQAPY